MEKFKSFTNNSDENINKKYDGITRRDFLKKAALITLGATFPFLKKNKDQQEKSTINQEKINNKKEISKEPAYDIEKQIEYKTNENINTEIINILKNNNYQDILKICNQLELYNKAILKYSKDYTINPKYLSGIIFIESKGDKYAYNRQTKAQGLCQFKPETAKEFELTNPENPIESIKATAKFINYYEKFLGTQDLAVATFHMGYGNMLDLIDLYIYPEKIKDYAKKIIINKNLNYKKLYFGINKKSKPKAYYFLYNQLKDESANYLFKVLAASKILELNKKSPRELENMSKIYLINK